jgi:hypothetical protein
VAGQHAQSSGLALPQNPISPRYDMYCYRTTTPWFFTNKLAGCAGDVVDLSVGIAHGAN